MAFTRPIGPAYVAPDRVGLSIDETSGDLILRAPPSRAIRLLQTLDAALGNFDDIFSSLDVEAAQDIEAGRDIFAGRNIHADQDITAAGEITASAVTGTVIFATTDIDAGDDITAGGHMRGLEVYAGPTATPPFRLRPSVAGVIAAVNTNGSGDITITHSLGVLCAITLTLRAPTPTWFGDEVMWREEARTTTTNRLRFFGAGAALTAFAVNATWIAHPL
jgi:hypothetical protein